MRITVDRNVVEFVPETPQETSSLETLWRVIVDCMKENKKLVPIGEFIPDKEKLARFHIEGVPGGQTTYSDQTSPDENTYYCAICDKFKKVNAGEAIPYCCGRVMEALD